MANIENLISQTHSLLNTNFGENINNIKHSFNSPLPYEDINLLNTIFKPVIQQNPTPFQNQEQFPIMHNIPPIITNTKVRENYNSSNKVINKNEFRNALLASIIFLIFSQPQLTTFIQKFFKNKNYIKPITLIIVFFTFFITSKFII